MNKDLHLIKLTWDELKRYTNGSIGINIIIDHPTTGMHLARAFTKEDGTLYYITNEHFLVGRELSFDFTEDIYFIGGVGE